MPRLLAPSISSTSTSSPALMLRQMSHWLHGVGVGPWTQLSALARIRAADVLPTPRSAGEQIGVPDAVRHDRPRQSAGDVLLTDQLVERLRPVAAGDDDIFAAVANRERRVRAIRPWRIVREETVVTFGCRSSNARRTQGRLSMVVGIALRSGSHPWAWSADCASASAAR